MLTQIEWEVQQIIFQVTKSLGLYLHTKSNTSELLNYHSDIEIDFAVTGGQKKPILIIQLNQLSRFAEEMLKNDGCKIMYTNRDIDKNYLKYILESIFREQLENNEPSKRRVSAVR